jgi:hypothetical protein
MYLHHICTDIEPGKLVSAPHSSPSAESSTEDRRCALEALYRGVASRHHSRLMLETAPALRSLSAVATKLERHSGVGDGPLAQLARQIESLQLLLSHRLELEQYYTLVLPADGMWAQSASSRPIMAEVIGFAAEGGFGDPSLPERPERAQALLVRALELRAKLLPLLRAPFVSPQDAADLKPDITDADVDAESLEVLLKGPSVACCWLPSFLRPSPLPLWKRVICLNLSQNALGEDGALVVAALARQLPLLSSLQLGKNKIGPTGLLGLLQATARQGSHVLAELDLSRNGLTTEMLSTDQVVAALKASSLKRLLLRDNNMQPANFHIFVAAILENTSLTTLDLRDNGVSMFYFALKY